MASFSFPLLCINLDCEPALSKPGKACAFTQINHTELTTWVAEESDSSPDDNGLKRGGKVP